MAAATDDGDFVAFAKAIQESCVEHLLATISRLTGLPLDMLDERRSLDVAALRPACSSSRTSGTRSWS